ncbi:MAG: Dabb family protein [Bacteroidales bacterium]|nr:Dabb family protein [Bacteroidales bacterium]
MIKHIVLWKLDEAYSATEKKEILSVFREKLEALRGKIEGLQSLVVNFNEHSAPTGNYDIMLETTLESMAAIEAYQVHPEHMKVVDFVNTLKRQRACIDFEF